MTRAEAMARWTGEHVRCVDPFCHLASKHESSATWCADEVTEAATTIALLDAIRPDHRERQLATVPALRGVIACGCIPWRCDPWATLGPDDRQYLRVMAARWVAALDALH